MKLLQENCTQLDILANKIAWSIVKLGDMPPLTHTSLSAFSSIEEDAVQSWSDVVKQLIEDHQQIIVDCQFVVMLLKSLDDEASLKPLLEAVAQNQKSIDSLRTVL